MAKFRSVYLILVVSISSDITYAVEENVLPNQMTMIV
jgi:hypothetical protein